MQKMKFYFFIYIVVEIVKNASLPQLLSEKICRAHAIAAW